MRNFSVSQFFLIFFQIVEKLTGIASVQNAAVLAMIGGILHSFAGTTTWHCNKIKRKYLGLSFSFVFVVLPLVHPLLTFCDQLLQAF